MITWDFMETIHSRSYTYIIKNVYSQPGEVFDNILTTNEQVILKNIFFDNYFPYYIAQSSVDDSSNNEWSDNNTIESQIMIHTFINDISNEISPFYQKIEHILQKFYEKTNIKFSSIIRCKLNLQSQVADYNKNNYQCPHIDQNYDHKVLIYYPYTSDGDTFLFDKEFGKPFSILLNNITIVIKNFANTILIIII